MELSLSILRNTPKLIILATAALTLFTFTPILHPPRVLYPLHLLANPPRGLPPQAPRPPSSPPPHEDPQQQQQQRSCDIFTGEWVPDPRGPSYSNATCWAIHEHQNCVKYGRPDRGYMRWRWKPEGCDLPPFNAAQFLEIVRGKSMAFVGDSISRNHMQSLICLLSKVEYPAIVYNSKDDRFSRWRYQTYDFTLAAFWSTHLVRSTLADSTGPDSTGLFNLYLDQPDPAWTTQIEAFDYVIISAGHWFYRPSVFYRKGEMVGCHYCKMSNVSDVTKFYGYKHAFRTAFRAILGMENFRGLVFLRSFAPSHFEGGLWNSGGNCLRRKPFRRNETALDGDTLELYLIQMEEYRAAEREAKKKKKEFGFRLLDMTQAMLLRPDGHPSRYGHWPEENVTLYNDCVHWCLPGPIDTWNSFLLEMLKMEGGRRRRWINHEEEKIKYFSDRKILRI